MSVATLPPPLPRVKPPPGARMSFDPAAAFAALLAEADRRGMTRYELAKRSGLGQPQFYRLGAKTTAATLAALLEGLSLPWRWLDTAAPLAPYVEPARVCPRCGTPVTDRRATYCDRPECVPPKPGRVTGKRAEVLAMHAAKRPAREIADRLGLTPGYVYSILRKAKEASP